MKTIHTFLAAANALALSACISTTTVTKIDDPDTSKVRGLRYSLPVTMLMVQPQADGSASYTWVYPPDPNNTYAINQRAFLSKFTLDVTVANGLLSKVNSQNDATPVAAKLFDSAQTAYAGAETKRAADAKTEATNVASAQTALAAASLALDQANNDVTLYASGTSDQQLAAKIKAADAQIAYNHAVTALQQAQAGAADAPSAAGPTAAQQYGPVLFRLVYDADGTQHLRAVNVQVIRDTVVPAVVPSSTGTAAPTWTLTLDAATYLSATKPLLVTVTVTPAPMAVDQTTSSTVNATTLLPVKPAPTYSLKAGKVLVTFPGGLPRGKYTVSPALSSTGSVPFNTGTVSFTVK